MADTSETHGHPAVGTTQPIINRLRWDTPIVAMTNVRHVRIDDELWEKAKAKAERRRESVAAVIKRALLAYVEDES